MALPEKNEVIADLETQPMVNEEEVNDSKQEEEEKQEDKADGVEDADREMNCEDDNDDGEALDLDINEEDEPEKPKGKKCIPGIVYLGHIPPRMRPKHMRTMLSVYGEIGRIFLQPEGKSTVLDNIILNMSITV